jgi:hypothetical protein
MVGDLKTRRIANDMTGNPPIVKELHALKPGKR